MKTTRTILILLLLIVLLLLPALHKIATEMPADWFINKFEKSWIGIFPFGVSLAFYSIVFLDIVGPLFMSIALVKILLQKKAEFYIRTGFLIYYCLFLILTFGSFMVQDYDNGFKDFMYFVGLLVIEQQLFPNKQRKESLNPSR